MYRYIILVVVFVIISVILFTNPFSFSKNVVEAIVPWTTLTLAFATFYTLLSSSLKERKAKEIERLAYILKWVEDIIRLTHVIETIELPDQENDTYEILKLRDKIDEFNRQREIGNIMRIRASRIEKSLYVRVRSLVSSLEDMLNENWKNINLKEFRGKLSDHEHRIYSIAKPLMDDIIKRLE